MIVFLVEVFGATLIKDDKYDRRIQYARLKMGGLVIMFNESSSDCPPNQSQMQLCVNDVAEVVIPDKRSACKSDNTASESGCLGWRSRAVL